MSTNSRKARKVTGLYDESDLDPETINLRMHYSLSLNLTGGIREGVQDTRLSHFSEHCQGQRGYGIGHQNWEEQEPSAREEARVDPGNDTITEEEDKARYLSSMTDMEKEWQPPTERLTVDLLTIAMPNKRKRAHDFHLLPKPDSHQVLALDDAECVFDSEIYSTCGSEIDSRTFGLDWEDIALEYEELSGASSPPQRETDCPRLSYAEALSGRRPPPKNRLPIDP